MCIILKEMFVPHRVMSKHGCIDSNATTQGYVWKQGE